MPANSTFNPIETRVPHGGASLFVRHAGTGPVLVCLHAGVADARMFDAHFEELSGSARVVTFDRRSFGQTTTPDEAFSNVEDTIAVMEALAVDRAVLLGCSQGGRVALDVALARPERVAGLILVAPVVGGMPNPEMSPEMRTMDLAINAAYEVEDLDRIAKLEVRAWLDGPLGPLGRVAGAARTLFLDMNRRAIEHPELHHERRTDDAWARLEEIGVPALVCCGTLDMSYMQDLARKVAARLPQGTHRAIRGTAHMPHLERPGEMTALVKAFLDGPL